MSTDRIDEQRIKETTNFHGHWCPDWPSAFGGGVGFEEMGNPLMRRLWLWWRPTCVAWTPSVSDRLHLRQRQPNPQDYGKNAFTFYRRRTVSHAPGPSPDHLWRYGH